MSVEFTKMHGTGNDFIVINDCKKLLREFNPEQIKKLCQRRTGIGADGLLILQKDADSDFRMRYYNSDGYESDMCANGSRCISYFAFLNKIIDRNFVFKAGDGLHRGKIHAEETVIVEVLQKKLLKSLTFPLNFTLPEGILFRNFINTGVPHVVLECKSVDNVAVDDIGRKLRFHKYYAPEGTNVNFVEKLLSEGSDLALRVRTFERGVDRETLSCGSGVTAAALSYLKPDSGYNGNVNIQTLGGNLTVFVSAEMKGTFLKGPVKIVYNGYLNI